MALYLSMKSAYFLAFHTSPPLCKQMYSCTYLYQHNLDTPNEIKNNDFFSLFAQKVNKTGLVKYIFTTHLFNQPLCPTEPEFK